jgi:DNA-binding LacI/PurR family transcriptional regulator
LFTNEKAFSTGQSERREEKMKSRQVGQAATHLNEGVRAESHRQAPEVYSFGDSQVPSDLCGSPLFDQVRLLKECRPETIVCANDFIAARVMASLASQGVCGPQEMRIIGIDDVKYANLLPVPLTTQHQNCADIGAMAMATMLQLQTNTVIRKSCGAHLSRQTN